jgi:large-conductance mechanosensitive channel
MYGIILNAIAYLFISGGAIRAFEWSQKYGSRLTMVFNYLLFFWSVFMTLYLVSNMNEILEQPLNEKLNLYEAMTNVIIAIYLLSFNLKHKE